MKRMKKELARVMDEAVQHGETPGVLALVWRNGEEKFFHASGYADLGLNVPIRRDSLFRIHSLTKPMTAVAAMRLVERGEMDIYAPVSDFLKGFCDQRVAVSDTRSVPVKRPMRVGDLFSMTSGLPYPGAATPAERAMAQLYAELEREGREGNQPDTVAAANRMGQVPLAFQPGDKWMYGTSADVLGAVVQVVSGQPLDQYMAENVFAPLCMNDTAFWVPPEKRNRYATLYEHKNGIFSPVLAADGSLDDRFARPNLLSGGGGLLSCMDDLLQFAQMLLCGGELNEARILSQRGVEWLTHNRLSPAQMASIPWDSMNGYGYGGLVRTLLEPTKTFTLGVAGEFGWEGYAGAYMTVCPKEDLIVLLLQHCAGTPLSPLMRKVRNVVFANLGA